MRVSETVKAAADAVATVHPVELPLPRLILELLRIMPFYRDVGGLPDWATAIRDATTEREDDSKVGALLWAIFEFAEHSLNTPQGYEVFDADRIAAAYHTLAQTLEKSQVNVPIIGEFTDW